MADPVSLLVMVAISAAVSAATYTLNYFLTPKPKAQEQGRLQGELQVQDSAYGSMIPLIYGGDPDLVSTPETSDISFVSLLFNSDGFLSTAGTIDPPAGVVDGDYLLAVTWASDSVARPPLTPAGWEKLQEVEIPYETGVEVFSVFGKFYNSADTTPYDFRGSPVAVFMDVGISAWRGVDPDNPIDASSIYGVETDAVGPASIPVTALTTTGDNKKVVAIGLWYFSGDPIGTPAGFISHHTGGWSVSSKTQASAGSSGEVDIPLESGGGGDTANDTGGGTLVALNPATTSSANASGGGTTIAGNVIYLSEVRPIVTTTPAEGGKGGPSAPPTKTITYYCDIGIKFCEGRQLLQKLYGDAEPLLDFSTAGGTTGLVNPDADPEPDYDNLTPIDPSDPDVVTRRETRYGQSATYDSNGVFSGTLKDGSTFRFYQGTETQPADPLYETYFQTMFPTQHAAGKVVTPTHKGDCLLFIQNFNLSNYGRVPSFRAKLSNADLFTADTIIDDLAQRVGLESEDLTLTEVEDLPVRGLPVFNRNGAADAIATLQLIHAFDLVDADGLLEAVLRGGAVAGTIDFDDLGSTDGGTEEQNTDQPVRSESEINVDLSALPARLDLSFLSATTDGESETVGFSRLETDAKEQSSQELNAVLRTDEGERVMRRLLDSLWAEARATRNFKVPHTYYQIKPGRAWTVPISETSSERVRVTEVNGFLPGSFECKGVVESSRSHIQTQIAVTGTAAEASGIISGNAGASPSVTVPNTSVVTFIDRLLRDRERQDGRPGYYVGARGFSADPWGGCTVKRDRGAGFERIVDLTEPATLGVIAVSPATLLVASTMDVDLYEGGTLPSFTSGEVAGGQGFVIAGDLVFQYQTATQLSTSPNRWQLSVISNIGAECSTNGGLAAGQRFALLNQAFRFVAIEAEEIGVARNYIAQSSGQNEADCARVSFTCNAPNIALVTPADWTMTAGSGEIKHTWTPFSDECVMTAGLIYEIHDDASGSPGDLIYSGNSQPFTETGLSVGTYTRYFRVRTAFADGEYLTDTITLTASPGIGVDPSGASSPYSDFITRFYQGALARNPTGGEMDDELDLLLAAVGSLAWYHAARQIGNRLFTSAEYVARARTNAEFLDDLYQAYLLRDGDTVGTANWLASISGGMTRAAVADAFGDSTEFRTVHCFRVYGWRPENHWEPLVEDEAFMFDSTNGDLLVEEVAS